MGGWARISCERHANGGCLQCWRRAETQANRSLWIRRKASASVTRAAAPCNGGGQSFLRTVLWSEFPANRENYREIRGFCPCSLPSQLSIAQNKHKFPPHNPNSRAAPNRELSPRYQGIPFPGYRLFGSPSLLVLLPRCFTVTPLPISRFSSPCSENHEVRRLSTSDRSSFWVLDQVPVSSISRRAVTRLKHWVANQPSQWSGNPGPLILAGDEPPR